MSDKRISLGVLVSGRGSNLQAIIDSIEEGSLKAEIGIVICDKEDAFALKRAEHHNINGVFVDPEEYPDREAFDAEILDILQSHNTELVIMAGYMRIVTSLLIDAYKGRIMNIHPAILPSFPGMRAQRQALDYGVKISGCTVHFVEEGVDKGPIIVQSAVEVLENDTEETLSERILRDEHKIYPDAIQLFAEGRLEISGRRVIIRDRK
ncbi:MAG: phosphoribosylglycinamide formyltransferase [Nitrospirota bacterium]